MNILYPICYYLTLIILFIVERTVFVLGNTPDDLSLTFTYFLQMQLHGLQLDATVAGYFVVIPLLLSIASIYVNTGLKIRKYLAPYNLLISALVAIVCVSDFLLYPFWHFRLDASVFLYLDSPKNAVASVSVAYIIINVVACTLLSVAIFCLLRCITPRRISPSRHPAPVTIALLLLCAPLAIAIRGGLGESTANIGKVYYSDNEFCNHAAVNPVFSMLYSLGKTDNFSERYNFYDEKERAEHFSGLFSTESNHTQKLLNNSRPNILLIILEGFGGQFLEAVSGRTNIAPNLNTLAKEGVLFKNCYSSSFRTDRGVLAALSGYPAFPDLSVMKMPVKSRTLPCLANSLNKAGYTSAFLYGGDINFTNMQSYLRTGGYSEITSDKDFPIAQSTASKWGVHDEATFMRLQEIIQEKRINEAKRTAAGISPAGQSPWHIGFLTLSSHEPWQVPYKRLKDEKANSFAYTDHCLGKFIEWFKQQPEWTSTLVVLIPDHGVYFPENISHQEHHHNTMLWLGGAVEKPEMVETIISQCDLPATLLAQLSLPHEDYAFSRDVFSQDYPAHAFAYFTFGGGMGFIDKTGYTVYDLNGERILENNNQPSKARLQKMKCIIQTLYDDLSER